MPPRFGSRAHAPCRGAVRCDTAVPLPQPQLQRRRRRACAGGWRAAGAGRERLRRGATLGVAVEGPRRRTALVRRPGARNALQAPDRAGRCWKGCSGLKAAASDSFRSPLRSLCCQGWAATSAWKRQLGRCTRVRPPPGPRRGAGGPTDSKQGQRSP